MIKETNETNDLLEVMDIYMAAEVSSLLTELYETFAGHKELTDDEIKTMLNSIGHSYPAEFAFRDTSGYALGFHASDEFTCVTIDHDGKLEVAHVFSELDNGCVVTIEVTCDGKQYTAKVYEEEY